MNNDKRLMLETKVMRRYLNTLIRAGYVLQVYDGEELHEATSNVNELINQITAVDEARVLTRKDGHKNSFLFFVMGNQPGEVLNDYGVSLEETIAPVNEWAEQYA